MLGDSLNLAVLFYAGLLKNNFLTTLHTKGFFHILLSGHVGVFVKLRY